MPIRLSCFVNVLQFVLVEVVENIHSFSLTYHIFFSCLVVKRHGVTQFHHHWLFFVGILQCLSQCYSCDTAEIFLKFTNNLWAGYSEI